MFTEKGCAEQKLTTESNQLEFHYILRCQKNVFHSFEFLSKKNQINRGIKDGANKSAFQTATQIDQNSKKQHFFRDRAKIQEINGILSL